ncbi:hypothetical protein [Vibrio diazotrophicus]|uniref:hypothetical protein n=1 Tax=Vibrio diazotrophicus TaxID=685 RepID=UPI003D2F670E
MKTNTVSLFCSGDFLCLEPELANLSVETREDSQSKRLRMKVPVEKFSAILDMLEPSDLGVVFYPRIFLSPVQWVVPEYSVFYKFFQPFTYMA